MSKTNDRILSILLGLTIIIYGLFGEVLLPIFQSIVDYILPTKLNQFLKGQFMGQVASESDMYNIGKYLLYHPLYLMFHVLLIRTLFKNNPRLKKLGSLLIILGIPMLGLFTYFCFRMGFFQLFDFARKSLFTFLKLPFILFVVEGSRILDNDIDNLIGKSH